MRSVKLAIAVRIASIKNVCVLTVFINLYSLRRPIFVIVISEQRDDI